MIIHSDVVEGLKKIDSESVDCVILDPPYNIGKDYGNNQTRLQMIDYITHQQIGLLMLVICMYLE